MKMSVLKLIVAGLGAFMMAAPASADRFYCDSRLVQVGDPIWRVGRVCPEPFWREDFDRPSAVDRRGRTLAWERQEVWTLNFGQRRLMRRLVFIDGELRHVESLGYGVPWTPGSRRCSPGDLARAGETTAEIFARCGEPDYRYDLSPPGPGFGYAGAHQQRERWTYDFGPRAHPRELEFRNGRLQRIERGRR